MSTTDHDGEWIDMSGIHEDATFEEPELVFFAGESPEGQKGVEQGFPERQEGLEQR